MLWWLDKEGFFLACLPDCYRYLTTTRWHSLLLVFNCDYITISFTFIYSLLTVCSKNINFGHFPGPFVIISFLIVMGKFKEMTVFL